MAALVGETDTLTVGGSYCRSFRHPVTRVRKPIAITALRRLETLNCMTFSAA
jgi:hypothetical protein